MPKEAVLQVRMDAQLKQDAERLFCEIGTSLPEAVRMFARQSVIEQRIPFTLGAPVPTPLPRAGASQCLDAPARGGATSAFGMFSQYANAEKRQCEKDAWAQNATRKHSKQEEAGA